NISHYEQIEFIFLMKYIPLNSFSLCTGNKFNQRISRNFEDTIVHLLKNHHKTLEIINLELKNNKENIDSLLFQIVKRCPKLKKLFFDGNVNEDMNLFYNICKYKQSAKGKMKCINLE
ncbi:hypothetical protein NQ314_014223, partial [Rhamnusium bicolor]